MRLKRNINEEEICKKYSEGSKLYDICSEYKIGKLKVKDILTRHGVELRDRNSPRIKRNFIISDFRVKKYENRNDFYYVAVSKIDGTEFMDCNNDGGHLTSHIREKIGIEIPTLYDRRIYYQTTGNYWWEQWFTVEKRQRKLTKKCPYCEWETVDIENKSGAFEVHLRENHNKTITEYLNDYPKDIDYFAKYKKCVEKNEKLKNCKNYVFCPICGEKYEKITWTHIKTHGLSVEEFKKQYPDAPIISENMIEQTLSVQKNSNLVVSKKRFISKYEKEICDFLNGLDINFETNRQILEGKEIDILVPSKKIGIEFNGLKWHTEWFGKKSHHYHLDKTKLCNKHGYGLIHIFEDEYIYHKNIVENKLKHILGKCDDLPRIPGRKCEIKEIRMATAKEFLDIYHIQGFSSSTVYLGAYHKNKLVAVMTFKNGSIKNDCWELSRFASNYNYVCQGIGGKLFKYFVNVYNPNRIISFADRRWTVNPYENFYTKIGFIVEKFNPPDYKYYLDESKDENKYKRIHKMKLNKKTLSKKYGFPLSMTETEMAKELGYDRIWDCGLIKYVWKNEK